MERLQLETDWFSRLLPDGIPIPSSTLLSGPGGSGKPLIGNVVVASWLRAGGSVVFMSLQYPDHSFIAAGLRNVAGLELDDYAERVAFIELDPGIDGIGEVEGHRFKANVVKPEIWDKAVGRASAMVPNNGPGRLVFISALNLLLFSPTYGPDILQTMIKAARDDRSHTYLMSASTSAKAEEIAKLETEVDNLIMTRSEQEPFRLFMKVERTNGVSFDPEEIEVPFESEMLSDVKDIADHSRKRVIPQVMQL